jgi:hypothetical protein
VKLKAAPVPAPPVIPRPKGDTAGLHQGAGPSVKKPDAVVIKQEKVEDRHHLATIESFGKLTDVAADGHCGFSALKMGLENKGQLERGQSITEFRRSLYNHAITNSSLLPITYRYSKDSLEETDGKESPKQETDGGNGCGFCKTKARLVG